MLIFDIGFNKGEFTQACCDKYEDCKVIGVDPAFRIALDRIREIFPPRENVIFVPALAAEEDDEEIEFFISPVADGASTASREFMKTSRFCVGSKNLPPNSIQWMSPFRVPTITLDTLIEQYGEPDYIKIDVEGYEYHVLSGLSKKQAKICFEWHEEMSQLTARCLTHLETLGYKEYAITGYFDEGPGVFTRAIYDEGGDTYLFEPVHYYSITEIREELEELTTPGRNVNYGMIHVR